MTIEITEYHYTKTDEIRIPDFCLFLRVFRTCDDEGPEILVFTEASPVLQ